MTSPWRIKRQRTKQHSSLFRDIVYRRATKLEPLLAKVRDLAFQEGSDKWVSIAATEIRLPLPTPDEVWALNDDPRWASLLEHSIQREQEEYEEFCDRFSTTDSFSQTALDYRDAESAAQADVSDEEDQPLGTSTDPVDESSLVTHGLSRNVAREDWKLIASLPMPEDSDPANHPGSNITKAPDCECEPCILAKLWREDLRARTPIPPAQVPHCDSARTPDLLFEEADRFERVKIYMAHAFNHNEQSSHSGCYLSSDQKCDIGRCSGFLVAALGSSVHFKHAKSISRVLRMVNTMMRTSRIRKMPSMVIALTPKDSELLWAQRLLNQVQIFKRMHLRFRNRCSRRRADLARLANQYRQSRSQLGPWKRTPGPSPLREVVSIDEEWPEYSEWPDLPGLVAQRSSGVSPESSTSDDLSSWHADDDEGEPSCVQRRDAVDGGLRDLDEVGDPMQPCFFDYMDEGNNDLPDDSRIDSNHTHTYDGAAATAAESTTLQSPVSAISSLPSLRPLRKIAGPTPTIERDVCNLDDSSDTSLQSGPSIVRSRSVEFRIPDYRERITPPDDRSCDEEAVSPRSQPALLGDSTLDYLDVSKVVRSENPLSPPPDENLPSVKDVQVPVGNAEPTDRDPSSRRGDMSAMDLGSRVNESLVLDGVLEALGSPSSPNKRDHDDYGEDSRSGREKAPRLRRSRTTLPDRTRKN